jgi:hypothetical protein
MKTRKIGETKCFMDRNDIFLGRSDLMHVMQSGTRLYISGIVFGASVCEEVKIQAILSTFHFFLKKNLKFNHHPESYFFLT